MLFYLFCQLNFFTQDHTMESTEVRTLLTIEVWSMEIWDVYDKDRNKTGRTAFRGDTLNDWEYHLAVDIWIINDANEILLQKRSALKEAGAGLWCCTGGAAIAGEDSAQACRREMTEELGVVPCMDKAQIVLKDKRGRCHKDVWLLRQNIAPDEFHLQAEEVDDVRWVTIEQLKREMDDSAVFWRLHYMDAILVCLSKAAQPRSVANG
jgi:8-oxo-dGTP diphosphatase